MGSERLTVRRLKAIEGALSAMLAGAENEGDWPDDVKRADMEAAYEWVTDRLAARERKS